MCERNCSENEFVISQMPKPKIKHDWYQTETHVIVTILAKNTENIRVDYGESTVCLFVDLSASTCLEQ